MESKPCPVVVGKTYNAVCAGVGSQGDGFCKVEGFVVFVPEVKVGDEVEFVVTEIRARSARGERV